MRINCVPQSAKQLTTQTAYGLLSVSAAALPRLSRLFSASAQSCSHSLYRVLARIRYPGGGLGPEIHKEAKIDAKFKRLRPPERELGILGADRFVQFSKDRVRLTL